MTPLKEYVEKNNTNDVAVQSYIFNRCAAVSLYVGSLNQHSKDQTVMTQSLKNYELFAEANMAHLVSKGNMTAKDARKNFEDNVPPMSLAYSKDGQENFVKRGDYTKGYIFDDFVFCNRILK
jgi:hypothetical protein